MSDARQKINEDYVWLQKLSTEKLNKLIDEAPLESNSDSDNEHLHALLTESMSREDHEPVDINIAWEEFKELLAEEESEKDLESNKEDGIGSAPEIKTQTTSVFQENRVRTTHRFRVRYLLVAVLVIVLLFSIAVGAGAFPGVKKAFQQWTDEVFSFSDKAVQEPGVDVGYDSLAHALSADGVVELLAPTSFPDGYVFFSVDKFSDGPIWKYNAIYSNEDDEIIIISIVNNSDMSVVSEKDINDIFVYESHGVTHYIISNLNRKKVVWMSANYECTISTNSDITNDELINMIDSIYGR